jgi:PAS domain S-box-containing protein
MLARDFMLSTPQTLRGTQTLEDAVFLFYKYKISGAPVVNVAGKIEGFLDREQIVETIVNRLPLSQTVENVMTKRVVTVRTDTSLEEAWQIPVEHLPVVDAQDRLVGMIDRQCFLDIFYKRMCRASDEVNALLQVARNGVVIINEYGIIEMMSEPAARLLNVETQAVQGKFIRDIVPNTGLLRVLQTGESELNNYIEVEEQSIRVNRAPIKEGAKVVGAVAIVEDLSETANMTKELHKSQRQVEALLCIFENLKQGIIVVGNDNIINLANHSYEEIMGIPREDLLGQQAKDVIENSRLDIVLKTGIPELADLQRVKGRKVVVNRVPIFKDGEIIGAIGEAMFKDISEVSALLQWENNSPRGEVSLGPVGEAKPTFEVIIGRSRGMVHVKNLAAKAARTDATVLILGESGTGKDLFAKAIHYTSARRDEPFISINCAAIPHDLLEAELFGYEEGAFTGARKGGKKGKFELADKGTIFLDEIGDMPLAMQAKLLRIMQEKTFEHVGGEKTQLCDVRIIAATNKPLEEMVKETTFREDLYYRLNVISLQLPPLRERREDISELIDILIPGVCHKLGIPIKQFAPETLALLREYSWPGNVRELLNVLEKISATVNSSLIQPRHLPPLGLLRMNAAEEPTRPFSKEGTLTEQERIEETLRHTKGNKALAAKILGIHRATLYEKIKKYKIL